MKGITSTQLATILGTDPRSCRRFLRRQFPDLAGQPGNWELDEEVIEQLKTAWVILHTKPEPIRQDADCAHKKAAVL